MQTLVTGATSGIGRALAGLLTVRGDRVFGVARKAEALADVQAQLGKNFSFVAADLASPEAADTVVRALAVAGFTPDAVVLNAGIYPHDSDKEFDAAVAAQVLAVNSTGALALVGALLPQLLQRGGQFVAVSSLFARRPDPLGVGYAASKAALTMAFRSLALRYRNRSVRFKVIQFGPIATEGFAGVERRRVRFAPHLRTAGQAAAAIVRTMAGNRTVVTYPGLVAWALRVTAFLPDPAFDAITRPFRR
ncbi:MAG: putative oxidoreductase [Parcubacteria group bacterium Gr01-1014_31]|nr:MAG: putative oxidoreductase [Parcubacteria group bacterium Gr01-1014_31]